MRKIDFRVGVIETVAFEIPLDRGLSPFRCLGHLGGGLHEAGLPQRDFRRDALRRYALRCRGIQERFNAAYGLWWLS